MPLSYELIVNKFLSHLPSEPFTQDRCWEWQGSTLNSGYGDLVLGSRRRPGHYRDRAHRFAWKHFNQQEIPEGMHVCHSCDNKKCCNPLHLFLGTAMDNYQDAVKKKRVHTKAMRSAGGKKAYQKLQLNTFGQFISPGEDPSVRKGRTLSFEEKSRIMKAKACRGEKRSKKLTDENIKEIFHLRSKGWIYREIGELFGVGFTCIYKIIKGKRWAHLRGGS